MDRVRQSHSTIRDSSIGRACCRATSAMRLRLVRSWSWPGGDSSITAFLSQEANSKAEMNRNTIGTWPWVRAGDRDDADRSGQTRRDMWRRFNKGRLCGGVGANRAITTRVQGAPLGVPLGYVTVLCKPLIDAWVEDGQSIVELGS